MQEIDMVLDAQDEILNAIKLYAYIKIIALSILRYNFKMIEEIKFIYF